MTQQENIFDLQEEMKYTGFKEIFNAAIAYYVQQGVEKFEFNNQAIVEEANHRIEHILYFNLGKDKDGPRHFYNALQTTLYMVDIPTGQINQVDIAELEKLLQSKALYDPVHWKGNQQAFQDHMQPYHENISQQMQLVASGDIDVFNRLMVKYNPTIHFEQDPAWLKSQEIISAAETRKQYFPHYKKITATEAPNLLYGRAVNKEYFTKEGGNLYNTWLKLNFNKQNEHKNYEYDSWHQNHGFNLDAKIDEFNFRDFHDEKRKDTLYSLRKGSLVPLIGVKADKTEVELIVETYPEKRTVNLYNEGKLQAHNDFRKEPRVRERSSHHMGGPSPRQPAAPNPDGTSPATPGTTTPSGKGPDEPFPRNDPKQGQDKTANSQRQKGNSHWRGPRQH